MKTDADVYYDNFMTATKEKVIKFTLHLLFYTQLLTLCIGFITEDLFCFVDFLFIVISVFDCNGMN